MPNPQLWVTEGENWWPSGRSTKATRKLRKFNVRREGTVGDNIDETGLRRTP